ncbi:hypothetical protein M0805_007249 [Coniferiporia weirii]|nr:hypothetical protein M0805_007249 [Coniferiporia weirii]
MQSNSHVHAAIMKGGIVWCVVIKAMGIDAAVEMVMTGPSCEGSSELYETKDCNGNSHIWWDDMLDDEDEELLCGVYKMYTGNGPQVKHMLWWPKSCVWEHSSMNCGYWSKFSKNWFQSRLRKIRSDQESVKNQTKWRSIMTLAKKAHVVMEQNQELSETFLNDFVKSQ